MQLMGLLKACLTKIHARDFRCEHSLEFKVGAAEDYSNGVKGDRKALGGSASLALSEREMASVAVMLGRIAHISPVEFTA